MTVETETMIPVTDPSRAGDVFSCPGPDPHGVCPLAIAGQAVPCAGMIFTFPDGFAGVAQPRPVPGSDRCPLAWTMAAAE